MNDALTILSLLVACAAGAMVGYWQGRLRRKSLVKHLREMEKNMAIKVSELETKIGALDAKVTKIWTEQQTKYDALVVLYEEVKTQLENVEVPAGAETAMTAFETKLQAFDDTIPDTEA